MYKLIRPLLFRFDAEKVHCTVTSMLKMLNRLGIARFLQRKLYTLEDPRLERELFGLKFKNPVGLAAGFDKNAEFVEELANFGFGFIEIGTVTPRPQLGNEQPRLFRLPKDKALINRMGFNNKGVDVAAAYLQQVRRNGCIIGGNIGKNKHTSNDQAVHDYIQCFERLFNVVDYFTVNVSSPNTSDLRALQDKEPLQQLLHTLQERNQSKVQAKPILLKIAPDLSTGQLDDIIAIVQETKIAGVIAINTTISREELKTASPVKNETGGLSGKPLANRSIAVVKYLKEKSKNAFPVIGVGGILTPEDAVKMLQAGADLIQVYTGFIYEGPAMVRRINRKILSIS